MVDNDFALHVYHRAQELDSIPGTDYEGTSVLAGAKAVAEYRNDQGLSYIGGYRWAFGPEDVVRTIGYKGPVVLGITWYDNMYDPDENNYIHADGPVAGGHCILANGFRFRKVDRKGPATYDNLDKEKSRIRVHNSWGQDWGVNGEGFITIEDLEKLLDDGEACIPTIRRV